VAAGGLLARLVAARRAAAARWASGEIKFTGRCCRTTKLVRYQIDILKRVMERKPGDGHC
jgi:hypothetical protein